MPTIDHKRLNDEYGGSIEKAATAHRARKVYAHQRVVAESITEYKFITDAEDEAAYLKQSDISDRNMVWQEQAKAAATCGTGGATALEQLEKRVHQLEEEVRRLSGSVDTRPPHCKPA